MRAVVLCCCKQKTAYELRISDWSSDVCSSDLVSAEINRGSGRRRLGNIRSKERPERASTSQRLAATMSAFQSRAIASSDASRSTRTEERRVGKEWVSTSRSRWSRYHYKRHSSSA